MLEKTNSSHLHNAGLPGESLFWQGGSRGLLLLHGLTATTASVRPAAQHFHELGWTVSAPLLPGHGTSPTELAQTGWRDWGGEAESCLRHLWGSCEELWVAGESAGALLALWLAGRYPSRLKGIVLLAPALQLSLSSLELMLIRCCASVWPTVPKRAKEPDLDWQGYRVHSLRAVREMLSLQRCVWSETCLLQHRILVIEGRHDKVVSSGVGNELAKRAPLAQIQIQVAEAGHHPLLEQSSQEETLHWMESFMR